MHRPPCATCGSTSARIKCRGDCGKHLICRCACTIPPRAQQFCLDCATACLRQTLRPNEHNPDE